MTTPLLVVFYTFFSVTMQLLFCIIIIFFWLLVVGGLSLSLCPSYWVGLHGSGPFLTPFVFVLFKDTILPCFGQKKKKKKKGCLINWVLETRFPNGRHMEKMPHQRWLDHENRIFETWFIGPKSSLLDSRC